MTYSFLIKKLVSPHKIYKSNQLFNKNREKKL